MVADEFPGSPSDWAALRAARELLRALDEAASVARAARDDAATRLRLSGVRMRRIAAESGVTESYLSRQAQKRGAEPLVRRRTTRQAGIRADRRHRTGR